MVSPARLVHRLALSQWIAPRIPCVILAALTDLYTFKLGHRLLPGRGEAAVCLLNSSFLKSNALD
jgi:hypothetical protein